MRSGAPPPASGEARLARHFAAAMARLGPFEPAPRLAAAVSGGPDSMALALLARDWVREQGGSLQALVVDHGLRAESAAEAALTIERLHAAHIEARLLPLTGLRRGTALAERARVARYEVLQHACAADGRLHLLLGHHAADQAETVLIRKSGGSGARGLAAMPMLTELRGVRLLRPLLSVPPGQLRAFLECAGVAWVEDPSNRDQRALRPRMRAALADPDGSGAVIAALCTEAAKVGHARAEQDERTARELASAVAIYPEGYAYIAAPALLPEALAALVQAIGGSRYPPASAAVAALAPQLCPSTLAGVRLLPAGRFGPGWLLVREAAKLAPAVPATPGGMWDGRFTLAADADPPAGAMLGALGKDAAGLRRFSHLPAAVLQTLPAIRNGNCLVAVPHLSYPVQQACARLAVRFTPPVPAAGAPFLPG